MSLTEEGIGEAVPLAAALPEQPPPAHAGGEAQRRPGDAHEDVAHADVQQDEVDGRPEAAELSEDDHSEGVAEDPRHQDEAEEYRHHRVAGAAQPAGAGGRVGSEAGAGRRAACGAEIAD